MNRSHRLPRAAAVLPIAITLIVLVVAAVVLIGLHSRTTSSSSSPSASAPAPLPPAIAGSATGTPSGTPGLSTKVDLAACTTDLSQMKAYMAQNTWAATEAKLTTTGSSPFVALHAALLSQCDVAHLKPFLNGPYQAWLHASAPVTTPTAPPGGSSIGQTGTPGLG